MKYITHKGLTYMNRSDIKLIIILLFISIILLLFLRIKDNNYAYVYYDNSLVLKIDLKDDNTYKVDGFNGEVIIEVKDNRLRVLEENSPLHICSKQGFTNNGSIVCLPNKIVITFDNENLDTIVG